MKIFQADAQLFDLMKFNMFTEQIEFTRTPVWDASIFQDKTLDDEDLTQIKFYLSNIHDWEPNKYVIGEACFLMSKRKGYHPVKQFIEKEKWDGINRLESWLIESVGCDDNIYTRHAGAKFLIAAVNRVYNPGCKFDHMMILEGNQGIGKSTLIEEVAGEFYLDTSFEQKDKDLIDSICQAMIVEVSELSGMSKKDIEWVRGFISRKVDRIRLPYAARSKDFKRKCVFIGTHNPSGNNSYLKDDTGNRRYWCIECHKINIDYIKKNRSQLWAEAFERYKKKEIYYIDNQDAIDIMKSMHSERELESPTELKIKRWLLSHPTREVDMMEIIENCLKIQTDGKMPRDLVYVSTPVGIIMRKLGWRKVTNQNRSKYYNPNYSEINNSESDMTWDE
jgi:predicted P-loop ATPase